MTLTCMFICGLRTIITPDCKKIQGIPDREKTGERFWVYLTTWAVLTWKRGDVGVADGVSMKTDLNSPGLTD